MPAVGADVANTVYGLDGGGVTVAVLDSGIRADLKDLCDSSGRPRVIKGPNFSPDPKSDSTQDLCGHGTHVAGLIGGNGIKSTGDRYFRTFRGVAPAVKLLSVKVLDEDGVGTVTGTIKAIEWCVLNKRKYNIRVINLSLGHPVGESYTTDPLCQAVEAAWKAGIVVVCAAGNRGRAVETDPTAVPPISPSIRRRMTLM